MAVRTGTTKNLDPGYFAYVQRAIEGRRAVFGVESGLCIDVIALTILLIRDYILDTDLILCYSCYCEDIFDSASPSFP